MGYLPDGGIKYKCRNGSKVLFGTPEVRLLFVYYLVCPFYKQPDKCGCVIKLHTKINSSLNLDNGVVIER